MPYQGDWVPVDEDVPCRKCGVERKVEYRHWESSDGAHEDIHYRCLACGASWWVEGSDY